MELKGGPFFGATGGKLGVLIVLSGEGLVDWGVLIGMGFVEIGTLIGGFETVDVLGGAGPGAGTAGGGLLSTTGALQTFQWGSAGVALKGKEPNAGTCGA